MSSSHAHEPGEATGLDRREFLRLSSAIAAASALASAGCQVPQELTVPFHDMPESLVDGMGRARFFHSVLDGVPVQIKTREGRPILVTPSAGHPSGRGMSARQHAALMDLYDPDRARGPMSIRRGAGAPVASNWQAIASDISGQLATAGSGAVVLTGPIYSPSLRRVLESLSARTGVRHVTWSAVDQPAARNAWQHALHLDAVARPRLAKADLVVGLGAEFLDRPEDGLEPAFASRRSPDEATPMNRFVQFEGRLTLTGANADTRVRVRDSQLMVAGAALAHELIVVKKVGKLAGDAEVANRLAPFAIDKVAPSIGVEPATLRLVANEMAAAPGRCLVLAGGSASASVAGEGIELAALLLNVTVGAFDAGLFDMSGAMPMAAAPVESMIALVNDMHAGKVSMLMVAGVNPVYDAPPSMKIVDALSKVGMIVSLNDRIDETAQHADALAPVSHAFECWSDAALPGGVFAIQQPVIQPLFDTRGLLDVLIEWAAASGDERAIAATRTAASATVPAPATAERAPVTSVAWHYLRAEWKDRLGATLDPNAFEQAWNEVLRSGAWQGPVAAAAVPDFASAALSQLTASPNAPGTFELQLYPHLSLADGRSGNNGWLHELPDPITRITWGGALSMAPRRFDAMKLTNGDLVEVNAGHATLIVPAYRHAGMHDDQLALPLGLGRTACGHIGNSIGANAFGLQFLDDGRLLRSGMPVTIRRVEGHEALAVAQGSDVIDRARRPLVPTTTLSEYRANPHAGTEQAEGGASAWPVHEYPKARWAMAIDLSKCNGCGKCVIGCQSENNIPIVGRRGMLDGREMSWLRIDRYYDAPKKDGGWDAEVWDGPLEVVEEPRTLFEPMLCQHCENAPCETVCPFSATMHSEDGLNQQIYNRCVGTRYCANNCPFKVRRFNYWEMSKPQDSKFFRWLIPRIAVNAELNTREPMQLKNNPEVTVRSRGVMEKCSFCVQRIRAARAEATRDGRSKDHFADGEVVPACMEACPAGAITFGDAHAPGARVAELAEHPRAMKLLESLDVKPSVSYLTKVRNDNG